MSVLSPEAPPKISSMKINTLRSQDSGDMNTAASSAYRDILKLEQSRCICERRPYDWASWNILCRGSIAKRNIIGDNGSPCRTPLRCLIRFPGSPFNRKEEVVVPHRAEIQFRHLWLNPRKVMMSRRYAQLTVSNAFEISNLINIVGIFFLCSSLITWWTKRKLSWIHRFLMKAFWFTEMSLCSCGARRFASTLELLCSIIYFQILIDSIILYHKFLPRPSHKTQLITTQWSSLLLVCALSLQISHMPNWFQLSFLVLGF